METDPVRKAHLQRIELLADTHKNHDSGTASDAADRLCEDRPAFWRRSQYHDQFTGGVCDLANMRGDLLKACDEKQVWTKPRAMTAIEMLDLLIPLNAQAGKQLASAYRKAGTFRESVPA